ncbi:MAG: hypothetical protein D6824_10055 [Planctomycetota bacterium]|nr:MAG: hypothetical protein D6824_10055 [Planctomycetota bacterium]
MSAVQASEHIVIPGQQTRCPACHKHVPRGARVVDAAWLAVCPVCGPRKLEDIAHPPAHRLSESEIAALTGEAEKNKAKARSRKAAMAETIDAKRYRALLGRMERIKDRSGLSWPRLGELGGVGSAYMYNALHKLRKGEPVNLGRLEGVLDAIEGALAGKDASAPKVVQLRESAPEPTPAKPEAAKPAPAPEVASPADAVADALGLSLDELRALRPQVDLLATALRNGLHARIEVEATL